MKKYMSYKLEQLLNDKDSEHMIIEDYQDILTYHNDDIPIEENIKDDVLSIIKEFPQFVKIIAIENEEDDSFAGCILMESHNVFSIKILQSGFIFDKDSEAISWAKKTYRNMLK